MMNVVGTIEPTNGLALLRKPFPPHQISQLPKGNTMLDYVGHAALTDRLLDADPNWFWEPVAFDERGLPRFDEIGGLWIKLTVCGQTRLGYGHPDGKKGGNAIKEAIGDALRNAAMRFGAALDLWHKGELHADQEAGGHSHEGAVSPPQHGKDPPRTNWGGRYPNRTALGRAFKVHHAEVERLGLEGCMDDLDEYLTSPEYKDFVATALDHAPHYLEGPRPENMPEEVIQMFALEAKSRDLIALRGNRAAA